MPGVAQDHDHRPQTILARHFGVERFEFSQRKKKKQKERNGKGRPVETAAIVEIR